MNSTATKKNKKEAASLFGQIGGRAVSKNRKHMAAIGAKGAAARWKGHKKVKKNK